MNLNMSSSDAPIDERYVEVAKVLLEQQESDRGCVIFGAAMLEDELESLLRAYCQTDSQSVKKVVDPLFHVYAPFSTFSAKIQVCYALGLISPHLHKTLDLIRRIRNDFAHDKTAVSFQSPKYQARLRAILASGSPPEVPPTTKKSRPGDEEKLPHMGNTTKGQFVDRLAFCICLAAASGRISASRDVIDSVRAISPLIQK